jgi:acyl carrier protein
MQQGLTDVIKNVLELDSVREDDSMQTIKSWDSLRHLNLVMAIEEHFRITFDPEEIPELTSVRNISEAIRRRTPT